MIGTIGSLVQETSNRKRWLLSTSLYIIGSFSTAMLVGAALGGAGRALNGLLNLALPHPHAEAWLIGLLAIAYAVSDIGLLPLPRPVLRQAVPITWWRRWRPYGGALAYGAALGTGVMTRIPFGAFYVLCAWCLLRGNPTYGAVLMGTYGATRALVMLPASWAVSCSRIPIEEWLWIPRFNLWRAQRVMAVALAMFGTLVLLS